MTTPASFAPLLERFFTQRLMQQRQASPHTISSYRDTFRQFLKFVQQRLHKPPARSRLSAGGGADGPALI
jgi:site-specific recombinase XerD